ncbi:MAG: OadG family transporter subunit [Myxococcota bacterium]
MLAEGVRLMVVGMLTVFSFLAFLVVVMKASAAFFEAFAAHFPEEPAVRLPAAGAGHAGAGDEGEIALVLALAEAARKGQRI